MKAETLNATARHQRAANFVLWVAAFVLGTLVVKCSAADPQAFMPGKLVMQILNVGALTLELHKEYQGERSADLLWLFEEVRGVWAVEEGNIVFRKRPSRSQKPESEPTLILQPKGNGEWEFVAGGILNQPRAQFFSKFLWKSADAIQPTDPGAYDAGAFLRARVQQRKFMERGQLRPLPESFPPEFVDASALLFRARENVIGSLLEYPRLSREVLEYVGLGLLEGEAGELGKMFVVPILGAHPNLSTHLQEKLFAIPKSPDVWRAVACNPSAAKTLYPEYLKRIREGDSNIRFAVARDNKAPHEAWALAIAPKEPQVLGEFARNKSAPSDLLARAAQTLMETDAVGLAANPSTPSEILNQLSKTQVDVYAGLSESERRKDLVLLRNKQLSSDKKQILWAIKRNPGAPPEAVERALRALATSTGADLRSTCVDDPRLPQDLIEQLSKDPSIQVRIVLAMNPSVPLPVLENLARDPYQMVSERARDNMKKRFPDVWATTQGTWVPLAELNPNNSLSQDIAQAIETRDLAKTRALLAVTDDPDIKPLPSTMVSMIMEHDYEPFKDLLREAVSEAGAGAMETMIVSPKLTPDAVKWSVSEQLLDERMTLRLILHATERGRTDLLEAADTLDMVTPLSPDVKAAALFSAVMVRSDESVDFWIKTGASPNSPVRDGLSAVGLATKLRLPDLLKRMDVDGTYEKQLNDNRKEFPPSPQSPLLGIWANKRNDASSCALTLGPDGTGVLGTTTSSYSVLWKPVGEKQINVVLVGPQGPTSDEAMHLRHDKANDMLVWDDSKPLPAKGVDFLPFYRLQTP